MNYRTKALWLPGLAALTTASVFLMVLQLSSLQPRIWWKDGGGVLYIPWLILLPLCGAAGAYLSRRGGGRRWTCLLAGLFPAFVMLAALCVLLFVGLFVDRNPFITGHLVYFLLVVLNWTVLPAVPLLLGAVPVFCRSQASR